MIVYDNIYTTKYEEIQTNTKICAYLIIDVCGVDVGGVGVVGLIQQVPRQTLIQVRLLQERVLQAQYNMLYSHVNRVEELTFEVSKEL